jgi:hypothetical protein
MIDTAIAYNDGVNVFEGNTGAAKVRNEATEISKQRSKDFAEARVCRCPGLLACQPDLLPDFGQSGSKP